MTSNQMLCVKDGSLLNFKISVGETSFYDVIQTDMSQKSTMMAKDT